MNSTKICLLQFPLSNEQLQKEFQSFIASNDILLSKVSPREYLPIIQQLQGCIDDVSKQIFVVLKCISFDNDYVYVQKDEIEEYLQDEQLKEIQIYMSTKPIQQEDLDLDNMQEGSKSFDDSLSKNSNENNSEVETEEEDQSWEQDSHASLTKITKNQNILKKFQQKQTNLNYNPKAYFEDHQQTNKQQQDYYQVKNVNGNRKSNRYQNNSRRPYQKRKFVSNDQNYPNSNKKFVNPYVGDKNQNNQFNEQNNKKNGQRKTYRQNNGFKQNFNQKKFRQRNQNQVKKFNSYGKTKFRQRIQSQINHDKDQKNDSNNQFPLCNQIQ